MTSCRTRAERRARLPLRRILCADPTPAFLELALRAVARHFPVQVVGWAQSGLQVLDLAAELAPDLVLLDCDLPGIDGLHATAWLKSHPGAPQVLLVPGWETPALRIFARAAGADGVCAKTALARSLLPLLAWLWPSLLAAPVVRPTRTDIPGRGFWPEPTRRRPPVRTLIVDDSVLLCQLVRAFLERCGGFQVVGTAADGLQALTQVSALAPDLVLMDWRMPRMDGLEATRRLKARPHCPVLIFMPLEDDPVLRAAALAAGADGFIGKQELPAKLPVLLQAHFSGALPKGPAPAFALAG